MMDFNNEFKFKAKKPKFVVWFPIDGVFQRELSKTLSAFIKENELYDVHVVTGESTLWFFIGTKIAHSESTLRFFSNEKAIVNIETLNFLKEFSPFLNVKLSRLKDLSIALIVKDLIELEFATESKR